MAVLRLLLNLSFDTGIRTQLVKDGIIPKLVKLLKKPQVAHPTRALVGGGGVGNMRRGGVGMQKAPPSSQKAPPSWRVAMRASPLSFSRAPVMSRKHSEQS